jgi:hypothetical protein
MSDRQFSILSGTGEVLPLSTGPTGDYALLVGVYGIGVPPVEPRYIEGAADGGVFRGKRYGMRPIDLPIHIGGVNRADMEQKVRDLARILDDASGMPTLIAAYADGTVYRLPFVYVSGLEGDGTQSQRTSVVYTLSLMCPIPFWEARDAIQFSVPLVGATVGLLPDLAALQVMSSVSFGQVTATNPGDVETPITWIVTGPGGPASATLNGRGWTYESAIPAGQSITLARDQSGVYVVNGAGASVYANMAPAPKFFNLPAGTSTVQLVLTGATGASTFAGFYKPRRKVVY